MRLISTTKAALPTALYTAAQSREADSLAVSALNVSSLILMKRAAQEAFQVLRQQWSKAQIIAVVCGAGNNAGDGFILAGLAQAAGIDVTIYMLSTPEKLRGDVEVAYEYAVAHDVLIKPWHQDADLASVDVIVDAMLGTGLIAAPRPHLAEAIKFVNAAQKPVLAIDVPSGLSSDTGWILGETAIIAEHTVTFIVLKQGLFTAKALGHVGAVHYACLGVETSLSAQANYLRLGELLGELPARASDANKGHFGHVLVVGGNHGFAGAALLAASSALRCGAGLVSVATRQAHCASFIGARPEIMTHAVEQSSQLLPLLEAATVVVIGPGLGQDAWAQQLLKTVLQSNKAIVIDADAVNLIAKDPVQFDVSQSQCVFTPHPGEAARVLDVTVTQIQCDRFAALDALQRQLGGTVLLKGSGTLICDSQSNHYVCCYGNPGMASGGMGDVLSGVIAALIAQGLAPLVAACLGACLHGKAADIQAAKYGAIGMLAGDLNDSMRALLNTSVRGLIDD